MNLDANDCSFGLLVLIMWLHYLVKCRRRSLAGHNNSYWVAHASAQKITETTKSSKICYFVFILDRRSTNWNYASTASKPPWVTQLLNVLLGSGVNVYRLRSCWRRTFQTCCNENNVMWHMWFFRDNNCQSRLSLFSWVDATSMKLLL